MRKTTATLLTLLAVLLVFASAACSKVEQEAYALYLAMCAAVEGATSSQAQSESRITMRDDAEAFSMLLLVEWEEISQGAEIQMAMRTTMDMDEMSTMDMSMYYKDGWMYQEIMGMKMRMPMPAEEAQDALDAGMMMRVDFGEKDIVRAKVTDVDGGKLLSFVLNGEALGDALTGMIDSLMGTITGIGSVRYAVGDVDYSIWIDSAFLPWEERMKYDVTITFQGGSLVAESDMQVWYAPFNTLREVSFPSDLDDYEEVDLAELLN